MAKRKKWDLAGKSFGGNQPRSSDSLRPHTIRSLRRTTLSTVEQTHGESSLARGQLPSGEGSAATEGLLTRQGPGLHGEGQPPTGAPESALP